MERTCERALELGLRSVAFTDHAEFTATTLLGDPALLPGLFRRWVRDGMLVPPPMPLERVNTIITNTVSTANSAFWFRRKMLNGL